MTKLEINLYLINQIVDILLWSWILLIMIKRVVCKRTAARNYHFYSDVFFLLASILAVTQFSDQFYAIATHVRTAPSPVRALIWIVFQKLITSALLLKYKNSQPRLFYNIKEEFKYVFKYKALKT